MTIRMVRVSDYYSPDAGVYRCTECGTEYTQNADETHICYKCYPLIRIDIHRAGGHYEPKEITNKGDENGKEEYISRERKA